MQGNRNLEMTLRKQLLETVVGEFKANIELTRRNSSHKKQSADDEAISEHLLKKLAKEYPLDTVGTSLYADKRQSKYTQPFHRRTQFTKPIGEHYDTTYKQE